jgi:hypothetical protein
MKQPKKYKHMKRGIYLRPSRNPTTIGRRLNSMNDIEEMNHRIYNDLPIYDDEAENEE